MTAPLETKDMVVKFWHGRRYVVFDPLRQPDSAEFIFVYFVEGHALCVRRRTEQNEGLVVNEFARADALAQYTKWLSTNGGIASEKMSRAKLELEDPPPIRKTCPQCDGQGTWFDSVNKASYGVISEGANIIERCPVCRGHGSVDDLLTT